MVVRAGTQKERSAQHNYVGGKHTYGYSAQPGQKTSLGLSRLCFFSSLLFFLTILRKSAYYSRLVYLLFQYYGHHKLFEVS